MTRTARTVQVPGEPAKPADKPADQPTVDAPDAGAGEPTAAASNDEEIAALRAQLAAANAEKAALQAQVNASAAPAVPQVVRRIGGCELTQAGWIVPADHGSPPKKG